MKMGDLVRIPARFDLQSPGTGVVLGIEKWVDSGAPDRNFGVTVEVLWDSGEIRRYEEDELEVINERR